jgi:hypothetical protein
LIFTIKLSISEDAYLDSEKLPTDDFKKSPTPIEVENQKRIKR